MDASRVSQVAVLGAGTMGAGIAGEFARNGCQVQLLDASAAVLGNALKQVASAQDALVNAGQLSDAAAEAAMECITTTQSIETACWAADLVVEAVSEDLTLKQKLFQNVSEVTSDSAILTSNTSGLSISAIAEATPCPERVAGMHFWNPPHLVPLVEVTRAVGTAEATTDLLMALCRRIGKRPVLVQHDIPGFIGNRLQFAVMREALHLMSLGIASAEDIDTAMTAGPGLRYGLLGPLRTADLGGLDVFGSICEYLFPELSASTEPPPLLAELVEQGKLGAKSGEGFYNYAGDARDAVIAQRDRVLLGFLEVLKREQEAGHHGNTSDRCDPGVAKPNAQGSNLSEGS